jgi:hypothetical protein
MKIHSKYFHNEYPNRANLQIAFTMAAIKNIIGLNIIEFNCLELGGFAHENQWSYLCCQKDP